MLVLITSVHLVPVTLVRLTQDQLVKKLRAAQTSLLIFSILAAAKQKERSASIEGLLRRLGEPLSFYGLASEH